MYMRTGRGPHYLWSAGVGAFFFVDRTTKRKDLFTVRGVTRGTVWRTDQNGPVDPSFGVREHSVALWLRTDMKLRALRLGCCTPL